MEINKYIDIPAEYYWALDDAIKEKQSKSDHYLKITAQRWTIETKKGKRGSLVIDQTKTLDKLKSRLARFSTVVRSTLVPNDHINVQSVAFVSGQFHVLSNYMGFISTARQPKYHLDTLETKRVITKHAILRWMVRNKSFDVDAALYSLGKAVTDLDTQIGVTTITQMIRPVGLTERQVFCHDGGVAILVIENPEEENYRHMKWALVTYISEDMVKDWNLSAVESEFPNVEKMTYEDFLSNYVSTKNLTEKKVH